MTNESRPPGWYPDAAGVQRWWDGQEWAVETGEDRPAKPRNPMGLLGLALATLALITASLSFPSIFVWLLSFVALALSVVATCLRGRAHGAAIAGIVVAVSAFLGTFVLSSVS